MVFILVKLNNLISNLFGTNILSLANRKKRMVLKCNFWGLKR